MFKQTASPEKTTTKQQTKPQQTNALLARVAEFVDESALVDKANLQTMMLNENQFSTIQRQTLASKIGSIQGNVHLQRKLIADRNQNSSIKQIQTHDAHQIQTFPNVIQLDNERLIDREEEATFTQTRTYETFEAEVRRWIARRVLSRTRQAHRERRLVPRGFLRGYYNTNRPGEPISMKVHFHSNGYSFRSLTFIISGQEIIVHLNQGEPGRGSEQPNLVSPTLPKTFRKFRIRMIVGGEGGEVVGGGVYTYELEERGKGGRNKYITFTGGGLIAGVPKIPGGGYGPSPWSYFTTSVPRQLEDFEGYGRIAAAGIYFGKRGWGWTTLVFVCNDGIQQVVEGFGEGTGLNIGINWFHGWWKLRD